MRMKRESLLHDVSKTFVWWNWTECSQCNHQVRFEQMRVVYYFKDHPTHFCQVCAPDDKQASDLMEYKISRIMTARPPAPPAPPPMRRTRGY